MRIFVRLLAVCLLVGLALPGLVRAGGDMGEAPYDVGEKLFARKNFKTALKYYRKALDRNDTRALYRMGLIHESAGKVGEAREEYQRFIEVGPPGEQRSDAAARAAAIDERRKKQTARSTELLERGKSLFKKGKLREAEKVLRQAASRDESRAEAHFFLGEVYLGLGDFDRAKAEYRLAKKSY